MPAFPDLLARLGVERRDRALVGGLSFLSFALFTAYYAARPLRDEIAANVSSEELADLWKGTFLVNLALTPLYAWFARRRTGAGLLAGVFLFFAACAAAFAVGLDGVHLGSLGFSALDGEGRLWLERCFYVWLSVFSLLVVSSFWSFASELCTHGRALRLFGPIAASGSLGGLCGPTITRALSAAEFGPGQILWVVAASLGLAGLPLVWFERRPPSSEDGIGDRRREPIGGTVWSGFRAVLRSRYLLAIGGSILLMTLSSTIFYFFQSDLLREVVSERHERVAYLARIEQWTNGTTLIGQLGVVGLLMRRVGVGLTLAGLPLVTVVGMGAVWWVTRDLATAEPAAVERALAVLGGALVAQRVARYALARPARETLFTLVTRDERYKSKNFLDTALYRGGDVLFAELFVGLQGWGLAVASILLLTVPWMGLWMFLSLWLGARATERSRPPDDS
jgi:AAA family ATP:ADP antiporter